MQKRSIEKSTDFRRTENFRELAALFARGYLRLSKSPAWRDRTVKTVPAEVKRRRSGGLSVPSKKSRRKDAKLTG